VQIKEQVHNFKGYQIMGLGASPNFSEFFKHVTKFWDLEIFLFSTFVTAT